eukprot:g2185.t1
MMMTTTTTTAAGKDGDALLSECRDLSREIQSHLRTSRNLAKESGDAVGSSVHTRRCAALLECLKMAYDEALAAVHGGNADAGPTANAAGVAAAAATGAPSMGTSCNNLQLNKLQATMERVRKVFGRIRPAEITSHNGVDVESSAEWARKDIDAAKSMVAADEVSRSRIDSLLRVLERLQAIHMDRHMHAARTVESEGVASETKLTKENFAYGMTPFLTWYEISKSWPKSMRVCVVGSSTGSIPFYLSLAFGLRTTGYEILQSLHRVACDVRRVCIGQDHRALIDFVCSDIMLVDDLEKHDAFILCSHEELLKFLSLIVVAEPLVLRDITMMALSRFSSSQ